MIDPLHVALDTLVRDAAPFVAVSGPGPRCLVRPLTAGAEVWLILHTEYPWFDGTLIAPQEKLDAMLRALVRDLTSPKRKSRSKAQPPAAPPRPNYSAGTSAHGLRFARVIEAFRQAERELGTAFQIRGRGHCPRTTLDGRYSRAVRPATEFWERFTPSGSGFPIIVFPQAIVERAARILDVHVDILIGRGYP
jgi:hypothetical protein